MNQHAISNLKKNNIKVILADEKEADIAIEKILIGALVEMQNPKFCMCCKADCLKL